MPQIKLIRAYDQAAVKRASGYKIGSVAKF